MSCIAKSSIFSGLNNLAVYTFHGCGQFFFADKFGFTEDEVLALRIYEAIFDGAIEKDAIADSEIGDVRSYYNGYVSTNLRNGTSVQVYNPWSIMNYLESSLLADHWVGTTDAGHYIMSHLFTKLDRTVKIPILADICRLMSRFEGAHGVADLKEDANCFRENKFRNECVSLFRDPQDQLIYEELDSIVSGLAGTRADHLWAYLYMAGYLAAIPLRITVHEYGRKKEKIVLQYFIPNEEVYMAWKTWILDSAQESINQDRLLAAESGRQSFFDALYAQNIDDFVADFDRFLRVFQSSGFCSYSDRKALQLHLVAALTAVAGKDFAVRSEVNSGCGRLDIMVSPFAPKPDKSDAPTFGFVFELKFVHPGNETSSENRLLKVKGGNDEKSLAQITNKHYVDMFVSDYPTVQIVYGIGVSFSAQCSWCGVMRYVRRKNSFRPQRDFVTYSYNEAEKRLRIS